MSAAAAPLLNGVLPTASHTINEALEYEKILKLRDEVFAGSHPRLTVPAHALRIVSPRPPQVASSNAQLNVPSPFPAAPSPNQLSAFSTRRDEDPAPSQPQLANTTVPTVQSTASNVSEFDPILLTKSDDLLRAETHLKRQRLEKALRDQFENKRLEARKKPAPAEAKPDFDISAVLARALDVAKPSSAKDDASASDSFDENSFYSSRAPDSTPERGVPSPSPSQQLGLEEADELDTDAPSGPRVQSAVMGELLAAEAGEKISPKVPVASMRRPDPTRRRASDAFDVTAMVIDDEEEEGEYSPPEATEQYPPPNEMSSQALHDSRDPRSRPLRRYSEVDESGRRQGSPSDANMRINARLRKDRGRQQQPTSPDLSQQYPRKKRKLEKRSDRKGRRNGGLSPDAFIKEENVSPPPFHDVQPLGSGKPRPSAADRPIIIDDTPQDTRYARPNERYLDSPTRGQSRQVEPLMPLSEPRVLSRAAIRPVTDAQDLRRVASMHNMRLEQPREYVEYSTPTRMRAPSYTRIGSPMVVDPARPVEEEYDRVLVPETRVARTPGPAYREVYQDAEPEARYQPQAMAPPPPIERIVIDQYGRRFREIIQPEARASAVPRAMSVRYGEADTSGYESQRAVRSGSVFIDAAPERRYAQDMGPPPSTFRHVAETPRTSAMPLSATREGFDPAAIQRSASVQAVDHALRQPFYVDERADFREPARMSTVRPMAARYEPVQPEMIARGQSLRPMGREGSVFVDDRAQSRREYLPVEQPRYRVVEPEERLFDVQGREVILDGGRDGRQRMVQRY